MGGAHTETSVSFFIITQCRSGVCVCVCVREGGCIQLTLGLAAVLLPLIIRVNTAGSGSSEIKCCISKTASIVLCDGCVDWSKATS